MYVKIRRHQHTRVHAHTGPRCGMWRCVVSATRRSSSSSVAPRACMRVYARVLVPPNFYILWLRWDVASLVLVWRSEDLIDGQHIYTYIYHTTRNRGRQNRVRSPYVLLNRYPRTYTWDAATRTRITYSAWVDPRLDRGTRARTYIFKIQDYCNRLDMNTLRYSILCAPRIRIRHQSINQSKILTKPHTGKEKPISALATGGSKPCVTK